MLHAPAPTPATDRQANLQEPTRILERTSDNDLETILWMVRRLAECDGCGVETGCSSNSPVLPHLQPNGRLDLDDLMGMASSRQRPLHRRGAGSLSPPRPRRRRVDSGPRLVRASVNGGPLLTPW